MNLLTAPKPPYHFDIRTQFRDTPDEPRYPIPTHAGERARKQQREETNILPLWRHNCRVGRRNFAKNAAPQRGKLRRSKNGDDRHELYATENPPMRHKCTAVDLATRDNGVRYLRVNPNWNKSGTYTQACAHTGIRTARISHQRNRVTGWKGQNRATRKSIMIGRVHKDAPLTSCTSGTRTKDGAPLGVGICPSVPIRSVAEKRIGQTAFKERQMCGEERK